jgi:arylformamidase
MQTARCARRGGARDDWVQRWQADGVATIDGDDDHDCHHSVGEHGHHLRGAEPAPHRRVPNSSRRRPQCDEPRRLNYRLSKRDDPHSAHFPDHYDDVAYAIAWVHAHIAGYGGDASRVALLGHSAGADIVSNVAVNPEYLRASGLALTTIRCAGPLDTEGFDKVAAGAREPDGEQDQWKIALGNNPEYLTETSATRLVKPSIGIPPMIGVVRGTPRRRQIEIEFIDRLRSVGVDATGIDATSLTHNEVNTRIGAAGDTVMTPPLVAFLERCFSPQR